MSCKMLQGRHRSAHNTRGTADGFFKRKDMKKEEGRKQKVRRLQGRRTRCWMIQIEQRDVESVLTSMTSSFRLHLQFPGYPMTVSHMFCRHEKPLLKSLFLRNSDLVTGDPSKFQIPSEFGLCRLGMNPINKQDS